MKNTTCNKLLLQEVLLPNNNVPGNSTFYTKEGDNTNFLMEDDNFFEDMTSLYRKQKVLFQRSCEQLKVGLFFYPMIFWKFGLFSPVINFVFFFQDVFKVEITPFLGPLGSSPFGKFVNLKGQLGGFLSMGHKILKKTIYLHTRNVYSQHNTTPSDRN